MLINGIEVTPEFAQLVRKQDAAIREWLAARKANSYSSEELSAAGLTSPTNAERSAVEVYEWLTSPPERYFMYIREPETSGPIGQETTDKFGRKRVYSLYGRNGEAITWMGDALGRVWFGRAYQSSFGDTRIPITVYGTNGRTYYGTYYRSAGDYARVKMTKPSRKA